MTMENRLNMKKRSYVSGLLLFLQELFRNPRAVGAAMPSSKWLAESIVKQISAINQGYILELGPGTGVITEALIQSGIKPEQLILIEQSATLATYLKEHFPSSNVIEGDARFLISLLGEKAKDVHTIVSSLPLRSLNTDVLLAITHEIENALGPKDRFIQYTYRCWDKRFQFSKHFRLLRSHYVWLNVPPARIDVYERMKA
jgi:phosphatidylethanolamine/phosphatidyl-N-methylethanolamine N-methyltransferase